MLVEFGADVNAPFGGPQHDETPLHWAASSDDVVMVDALLDAGADIEARGGTIAGGTALDDAVGYEQWRAAARLLERGAVPAAVDRGASRRASTPSPPGCAASPASAPSRPRGGRCALVRVSRLHRVRPGAGEAFSRGPSVA